MSLTNDISKPFCRRSPHAEQFYEQTTHNAICCVSCQQAYSQRVRPHNNGTSALERFLPLSKLLLIDFLLVSSRRTLFEHQIICSTCSISSYLLFSCSFQCFGAGPHLNEFSYLTKSFLSRVDIFLHFS